MCHSAHRAAEGAAPALVRSPVYQLRTARRTGKVGGQRAEHVASHADSFPTDEPSCAFKLTLVDDVALWVGYFKAKEAKCFTAAWLPITQ